MNSIKHILTLFIIVCIFFTSCNNQTLRIFKSSSARTQYTNTLNSSGIGATKIGLEWKNSANESILKAPDLAVPVSIQGSFKSKSIEAKAWKIKLEQGSSVNIFVNWQASDSSKLIVDLLEGSEWKELESFTIQSDSLKFEAEKSGSYLLRLQPELLGEGNFQIKISGTATYAVFPVQGKNSAAIQSVWGDVRDGGQRSHEGVDIFATRGTPVLAPVAGVVTAVRDRGLGGKQVWVRDPERDWNLYFAHLDTQLVSNLQRVNPGDTLGLVGNTGNARTTAPHLHFGIYQNGAINPFPAIEDRFKAAPELKAEELPHLMKVGTNQAKMRREPSTNSDVISTLKLDMIIITVAATADWYQVETMTGEIGFLHRNLVAASEFTSLESKLSYAFSSPISNADSLYVNLEEFNVIGEALPGYNLIVDMDGNLLYLRSSTSK
ncbi:murein DD-endopeptidase MepM/ murein hydrolase activator NlpD [Algoriphagus ratkowskyi]|uniref:Murein DD-endopeptidase MepM/ murein hydrolase activator NlpD n=1 Tax=Algoriphagus ratkowskyi TaxID=57028 RepID=A0A2W7S2V1_9BACT|nr:peptidoglycan DD-metalloendopeptidase family protein [Algoriphagus ratkowskyi]PZX61279.1 murein DD-endopeptidase MepM/ murein hydrolase activator NlpD [Algoriphagus ratkowskyi]TXD79393.1 peptidoglycan DD-metalloendopeptidase family protein [Algoriphagus ratkowskyi]